MTAATKNKTNAWQPHDGSEQPTDNTNHLTVSSRMDGDNLTVTESIVGKTGTRTYYWYYDLAARLRSTSGCLNDDVKAPMSGWEADWILANRMPEATVPAQTPAEIESAEAVPV